ncbi:hypothetical protein [Sphingomonas sp.]|uniref:hypothetical protein n=1 Tax=Sphingomonas sp. TaxID=28214 RepID=UPI003B002CCD
MRDSLIFHQRATECREQADAAELDNVRDRCLRAEAAWSAMAQRSLRTENARDAREAASVSAEHAAHDSDRPGLMATLREA